MAYDLTALTHQIHETEEWLTRELQGIRTGRATPTLLDAVKVEAYGARSPIRDVGSISVEDARTLRVVPWDKSLVKSLEKGIVEADLGVGVSTDEAGLRVSFPELTSERRTQLTRAAGEKTEQARVTLRSHRTDALKALEAAEKAGGMGEDEMKRVKDEIQKCIDTGNESLATLLARKEEEIAH